MPTLKIPSASLKCVFIFLYIFFIAKEGSCEEGRSTLVDQNHVHTFQVSSLFPSTSTCKDSTKVTFNNVDNKASLKVVHKHGPCFQQNEISKRKSPTANEILLQDESRVNLIHSRLSRASEKNRDELKQTKSTTLPAIDGSTLGSGNYIVSVGIGTPTKNLSLIFDTGSDLTWTQCQPCVRRCYNQKDPIFNPLQSNSYTNVSCEAAVCTALRTATGNLHGCSSSTCIYRIQYGDSSFSIGFFGSEKITLDKDVFDNIYFGCGQNNQGLFGGSAGLLGLGRDRLSFISQTDSKYKKIFSYCLPSSPSTTGFLTFGGYSSKSTKFTPISADSSNSSFYGIDFTAISVGRRKVAIPQSVFSAAGSIIDSGTVITRLPPAAYTALRDSFRKAMSKYPMAPALSILDTCYDLSNYTTVAIPKVGLFFKGGVQVNLGLSGILYASKLTQVCLAFAPNRDSTSVAILGNTQQQTFQVVYDGARGRIGFAPGAC